MFRIPGLVWNAPEKRWFIAWSPLHLQVQLKQAEHLLKVSVGSRRLAPGEGCKGKDIYFVFDELNIYNFGGASAPLAKKREYLGN